MFGHFVSYLNRLGNRNKSICFCFTRLIMLRSITSYRPTCSYSVIKIYKYIFATLVIACFTWNIRKPKMRRKIYFSTYLRCSKLDTKCPNISEVSAAKIYLYIFIAEPKRVGSEGANTAKVSKQKDTCVFLFGNRRV